MSAMQSATDNAKDLQKRLEQQMTVPARQKLLRSLWRSLLAPTLQVKLILVSCTMAQGYTSQARGRGWQLPPCCDRESFIRTFMMYEMESWVRRPAIALNSVRSPA